MGRINEDSLSLKAAIEFGSDYIYTIKNGGHGLTLVVDAGTRSRARIARQKIPTNWEDLFVLVIYNAAAEEDAPAVNTEKTGYE